MFEYELRGCLWGVLFFWYEYSLFWIKYLYICGKFWDLWIEVLEENNGNCVVVWVFIVENEDKVK